MSHILYSGWNVFLSQSGDCLVNPVCCGQVPDDLVRPYSKVLVKHVIFKKVKYVTF